MSRKQLERHRMILQVLADSREHRIDELMARTGVSLATIRRDLEYLESASLLVRTHGGARAREAVSFRQPYAERVILHSEEKRAIAAEALKLIQPRDTVALCNGSTVAFLAEAICASGMEVTVVTNAIDSALKMAAFPKVRCILIGGEVTEEYTSGGFWVDHMLERVPGVDKTFLSCDGIHVAHGLTAYYSTDAQIQARLASIARQVVALIDHSKFGVVKLSPIIPISKVDVAVTDDGLSPELVEEFRSHGLNLHVVNTGALTGKVKRRSG